MECAGRIGRIHEGGKGARRENVKRESISNAISTAFCRGGRDNLSGRGLQSRSSRAQTPPASVFTGNLATGS